MERGQLRSAEESSADYHKIHKKMVGPQTASRLLLHYDELTQSQDYEHLYEAGWAIAEAALVSDTHTREQKVDMLKGANDAWSAARDIQQEKTLRRDVPCQERLFRIDTTKLALPAFRAIVQHNFNTASRADYHEAMLDETARTSHMLEYALDNRLGHVTNYKGLLSEQLGILALSRELSGKFFTTTSLARSGTGRHYPAQTHDLQVFSFRRGQRTQNTPVEVKFGKTPSRYDVPVLNLKRFMHVRKPEDLIELQQLYEQDFNQPWRVTDEQVAHLDGIRNSIVDIMRSYHRRQRAVHTVSTPVLQEAA